MLKRIKNSEITDEEYGSICRQLFNSCNKGTFRITHAYRDEFGDVTAVVKWSNGITVRIDA